MHVFCVLIFRSSCSVRWSKASGDLLSKLEGFCNWIQLHIYMISILIGARDCTFLIFSLYKTRTKFSPLFFVQKESIEGFLLQTRQSWRNERLRIRWRAKEHRERTIIAASMTNIFLELDFSIQRGIWQMIYCF